MPDPIRQEIGADGLAVWWFDRLGEEVNTLGRETMACLEGLVASAARAPGLKGLLLASAKSEQFVAGADLEEMRALLDSPAAARGAREAAALGHRVYSALEALAIPTVAVINGTCMGGGTELALACRYRVASDSPALRIALPETKLGILPAWGGCTRLPRLVGAVKALDLLLSGRELRGKQALKAGLVDDLVPSADPLGAARRFLAGILREGDAGILARRRACRSLPTRLLEATPPGRAFILSRARAGVLAQTGGNYPAPERALEAVRAGLASGPAAGFAAEEEALAALVATPAARHLVGLFFMSQENRRYGGGLDCAKAREVGSLGILGAGLMGAGIAQVASGRGLPVRLKDVDAAALGRGLSRIAGDLRGRVRRKTLTEREFSQQMGRFAVSTTWEAFGAVDLVVEAVVERLEVKRQVLSEFQAANPRGIFASNTSTLPISSIAEGARDPGAVVGLHFFNPVPRMPLVEVIPGRETREDVAATALALARRLGKFVVVVKDSPGFLVNRILAPYLGEAAICLEEGAPMEALDGALRRFGMPMGPVELIQQVGLGVAQHAGKVMQAAFPDRLEGSALLDRLTPDCPFYLGEGKARRPNPAIAGRVQALGRRPAAAPDWGEAAIQERLVMAMVNEAAWALGEGVVPTPAEVDLAMVFGTGFAPFRGGLLRHADTLGSRACAEAVERLRERHGRRFTPAPRLLEMARQGRGFYPA